jgi:cysteine-rich repeat protein
MGMRGRGRAIAVWGLGGWLAIGAGCAAGVEDASVHLGPGVGGVGQLDGAESGSDGSGDATDGDTDEAGTGGLSDGDGSGGDGDETDGESGEPEVEAVCGDGVVQGAEQCDHGVANAPAGNCMPTCTLPVCGDGFVHPPSGEACDDGNASEEDGCRSDCTTAVCGDGIVNQGVELCDDGNTSDADGCTSECTLASCGDGVLQAPEQCDDGNASNGDGCLATCVPASCGDGFVRTGVEQCDDGNGSNEDACLASCQAASCGDGYVQAGVEQCDTGGDPGEYSCSAQCQDQEVWYQWSFNVGQQPSPMACSDFNLWRSALADDHTSIRLAGTYDQPGRTCTGPAATTLCNALRNGTAATIDCDGHTWHVGDCVGTMEVTVDGSACACSSPGYALRPCVPYVDWGGAGTSTCFGPTQQLYAECGFD